MMHQTYAKKRFGQNFLVDQNIIQKIIQAINPKAGEHLIEIGPGIGAITKPLLEKKVQLEVIEIDRDLIEGLHQLQKQYPNLHVHAQDALTFDFSDASQAKRILGNLPYNISSPLLLHCFKHIDAIIDMHFMLQKEVVDRLTAVPNTKDYGRLSIITQYFCEVEKLFEVSPSCFHPAPKVTSAVFRLKPKQDRVKINVEKLEMITQHAFGQRRKTLRNSLASLISAEELLAIGIDPMRRAETLTLNEYIQLTALPFKNGEKK
ncbi:MAG: rRNA ((1518)-N(6)/adenine(1519)-N(6))-dimethyltransferase [Gammaproteobacteria bacterium]|jgi:16S rRNA (adenine1518-N6/adenine1519-N6)-dimethyltransferase|nr:rRNA ((1518)-N(6)/adenine(1519)-N(6))-dimethyltransferase [Gammaproteobacteria bacterium]